MNHLEAVQQAKYHFDHKANYAVIQRRIAAVELAEWGLFSNRQISTFTGLRLADVGVYTRKTDRTGGKLEGEALGWIIELIRLKNNGEVNDLAVARTLEAGVSAGMLSRLIGQPQTTLSRQARRHAA